MRTSHHSNLLLNSCPLLYELTRVRDIGEVEEYVQEDRDSNADLSYGRTIGIGFQELIRSKDLDAAIWKAFCSYSFWETDKKCFEGIVSALEKLEKEFPLNLYEVVLEEAAIKIRLSEDDYWCGFIDLVLRRKDIKKYIIGEVKSCGINSDDLTPLYQNSAQAMGYSVVLPELLSDDEQALASFETLYLIAHIPQQQWFPKIKTYIFQKTALDRKKWLLNTYLAYQRYCQYRDLQYWPAQGDSCLRYNRPCNLFGICQNLNPIDYPFRKPDKIDIETKWDIDLPIETLIANEEERAQ